MKGSQQEAFEIRNRGVNNRQPLLYLLRRCWSRAQGQSLLQRENTINPPTIGVSVINSVYGTIFYSLGGVGVKATCKMNGEFAFE